MNLGGSRQEATSHHPSIPFIPSLSWTSQEVSPAVKHVDVVYTVNQPYKYTMLTKTQRKRDGHEGRAEVGG